MLHPTMAQALKAWMPPTMPLPTMAELEAQRLQDRRAEFKEECRSGFDCVDADDEGLE